MEVSIELFSDENRIRPENSEVERLWADNEKANVVLNWQPQYDGKEGFKQGMFETITWFRNSENLMKYKSAIYNL